jgi:hypothetical protein
MAITNVAYAYVEPGGAAPDCKIRTVSEEIRLYLSEHVDDLLTRAGRDSSAPAFFRTQAAEQRFNDMLTGTKDQFLAAASELTERLFTAMDNRSKKGFLVAVRRSAPDGDAQAAVLKLDVSDKSAAAALLVKGEERLETVRDLLDRPGELQKGAVYPDPRTESNVVVGDKVMVETAQYFLRALEVQQIAAAGSATKSFVDVVAAVATDKVDGIVRELDAYSGPVSPPDFFQQHPDLLTTEEREQTLDQLEQQPRPVRIVNPLARPPKAVVFADGIAIRGGVNEMQKVGWVQHGAGWQIQINVVDEPRKRYE